MVEAAMRMPASSPMNIGPTLLSRTTSPYLRLPALDVSGAPASHELVTRPDDYPADGACGPKFCLGVVFQADGEARFSGLKVKIMSSSAAWVVKSSPKDLVGRNPNPL